MEEDEGSNACVCEREARKVHRQGSCSLQGCSPRLRPWRMVPVSDCATKEVQSPVSSYMRLRMKIEPTFLPTALATPLISAAKSPGSFSISSSETPARRRPTSVPLTLVAFFTKFSMKASRRALMAPARGRTTWSHLMLGRVRSGGICAECVSSASCQCLRSNEVWVRVTDRDVAGSSRSTITCGIAGTSITGA